MIHTTDATAAPWEAEWSEPLKLSPQGEEGEWEGATPLGLPLFVCWVLASACSRGFGTDLWHHAVYLLTP